MISRLRNKRRKGILNNIVIHVRLRNSKNHKEI